LLKRLHSYISDASRTRSLERADSEGRAYTFDEQHRLGIESFESAIVGGGKMQVHRIGRTVLGTLLLTGLTYSVLGLTVTPKVAQASSCDCDEQHEESDVIAGNTYCQNHFDLGVINSFTCPDPNNSSDFLFTCIDNDLDEHGPFALPCQ
jgi:hypothetical protein